jgi:hypothetical protein
MTNMMETLAMVERLKGRQREVWELIRNALPGEYGVSIGQNANAAPGSIGEARLSLQFYCAFAVDATNEVILATAEIARRKLDEMVCEWSSRHAK